MNEQTNLPLPGPRVSRVTIGRLYSLGNYEHVRYEVSVELPPGTSPASVIGDLDELMAGMSPKKPHSEYAVGRAIHLLSKPEPTVADFKGGDDDDPFEASAAEKLGHALREREEARQTIAEQEQWRRLFVVATRSKHPITLALTRRDHRPAADCIDLSAGRWSPVERPGRSARTLARIQAGRRQIGTQFLAPYYGSGSGETGRSLQRPIGTLTTRARWAVIDGDRMRMVRAVEGRALMGFPDHYRLPANEATAWHLIGNAVGPVQAADVINAIREAA